MPLICAQIGLSATVHLYAFLTRLRALYGATRVALLS